MGPDQVVPDNVVWNSGIFYSRSMDAVCKTNHRYDPRLVDGDPEFHPSSITINYYSRF